MFKNYLITAFRNLVRNKLYSVINIGGLAIGLAACILIFTYVKGEFSFDRFYADADRIYRVEGITAFKGRDPYKSTSSPAALAPALQNEFPQIEAYLRLDVNDEAVSQGHRNFFQKVVAADHNFFEFFDLALKEGDPATALSGRSSLVLTEEMARKFFGEEPALGQSLTLKNDRELLITGVLHSLPANTHLQFDMLRWLDPADFGDNFDSWGYAAFLSYIKLGHGQKIDPVLAGLDDFSDRHVPAGLVPRFADSGHELFQHVPVPLADLHLKSFSKDSMRPRGDLTVVLGFTLIAVLILGIAVINFINLATARFTARSREVAVRKVVGASRGQLATQFLFESTALVFLALLLSLLVVQLASPWFAAMLKQISLLNSTADPAFLFGLMALGLVVGLGSGIYPSLYLSSIRPAQVLGASRSKFAGSFRLRTVLVVFQFGVSIALIIATTVISGQLKFMRDIDLGFATENVLVIRNIDAPAAAPYMDSFLNRLRQHPDVIALSRSNGVAGDDETLINSVTFPGHDSDESLQLRFRTLDHEYLSAYGVQPLAGRLFDAAFNGDAVVPAADADQRETASAVINESALQFFGFANPQAAIGQTFVTNKKVEWTIVGVIPDMHVDALSKSIEPMYYSVNLANLFTLSVHFRPTDEATFFTEVDRIWAETIPGVPIAKVLLSENLEALYADEHAQFSILMSFSVLAVLVSSLGLFGLASFTTRQRIREVGIRKTLGASSFAIVRLLVAQFSKPALIANLIAWPVAWYFLSDWLSGFFYRIELSLGYFLAASLITLALAWLTVAGHAWWAARSHPVAALRYE